MSEPDLMTLSPEQQSRAVALVIARGVLPNATETDLVFLADWILGDRDTDDDGD